MTQVSSDVHDAFLVTPAEQEGSRGREEFSSMRTEEQLERRLECSLLVARTAWTVR